MAEAVRILAIGGAHVDRRGKMIEPFVPGASVPGAMAEEVGGGAFNALRLAVRRGAAGSMLSVRGGDAAGAMVAGAITERGIADLSVVFLDRATPSYTALLDRDGDVVAALADMGLYDIAFARQMRRAKVREAVAGSDAILCDANLPEAALERLATLADGRPLFAIGISPGKVGRLAGVLSSLSCLFLNRREAAVLTGLGADSPVEALVARLRLLGLKRGVITQGSARVTAFDDGGHVCVTPPRPEGIVDVTGAGDALAGACCMALLRGRPLGEALREGVAAALLAIGSATVAPAFSQPEFATMLATVPAAEEA